MVFARAYCERKIRIALIGALPRTVQSNLRDETGSNAVYGPEILDYINQRVAHFKLRRSVVRLVVLHVEFHVAQTASSLCCSSGILGKDGRC